MKERIPKMKKRIIAFVMAVFMLTALCACGSKPAETSAAAPAAEKTADPVHLSLGHTANTSHHYQVLSESFKSIVEEKTNGAVIIDIYPAEQLGSGVEMLESVKTGTQDIVIDPDAYLGNYDTIFNVIGMPYQFSDWNQFKAIIGTEVTDKLEQSAEGLGLKIIGWAANGMRVFTTNNEITSPESFKGLKIRAASTRINQDIVTALGAEPTTLSMSELYNGISTGIVDGQENPTNNIISNKLYEVQKYITVTHHQTVSEPMIMNLAKFNSLTAEQQQIILDAAKEVCAADVDTVAASEEADFELLKEKGCVISYPDLAPFQEIMAPIIETYCSEFGEEFTALYNAVQTIKG